MKETMDTTNEKFAKQFKSEAIEENDFDLSLANTTNVPFIMDDDGSMLKDVSYDDGSDTHLSYLQSLDAAMDEEELISEITIDQKPIFLDFEELHESGHGLEETGGSTSTKSSESRISIVEDANKSAEHAKYNMSQPSEHNKALGLSNKVTNSEELHRNGHGLEETGGSTSTESSESRTSIVKEVNKSAEPAKDDESQPSENNMALGFSNGEQENSFVSSVPRNIPTKHCVKSVTLEIFHYRWNYYLSLLQLFEMLKESYLHFCSSGTALKSLNADDFTLFLKIMEARHIYLNDHGIKEIAESRLWDIMETFWFNKLRKCPKDAIEEQIVSNAAESRENAVNSRTKAANTPAKAVNSGTKADNTPAKAVSSRTKTVEDPTTEKTIRLTDSCNELSEPVKRVDDPKTAKTKIVWKSKLIDSVSDRFNSSIFKKGHNSTTFKKFLSKESIYYPMKRSATSHVKTVRHRNSLCDLPRQSPAEAINQRSATAIVGSKFHVEKFLIVSEKLTGRTKVQLRSKVGVRVKKLSFPEYRKRSRSQKRSKKDVLCQ